MFKRSFVITCVFLLLVLGCSKQAVAQKDKIEGTWWNAERTAKIQIYKAVDLGEDRLAEGNHPLWQATNG